MKKFFLVFGFIIAYSIFLSIGIECLLNLLSLAVHVSLDSDLTVMGEHRRFLLFCIVLGLLATAAIIALLVFNINTAEKFDYSKKTWYVQMISALVVSLPMLKIWEMLFEYLQKTF